MEFEAKKDGSQRGGEQYSKDMQNLCFGITCLVLLKLMMQNDCLGCRQQFQESNEFTAHQQNTRLAFYHYGFPLSNEQLLALQKQVLAMLNTQGGVILASVDPSKCIVGLPLTQNQQNEYRKQCLTSLKSIKPSTEQLVKINFVPIKNKNDKFAGKYMPVILVRRGLCSELYMFNQLIQINYTDKVSIINVIIACLKQSKDVRTLTSEGIMQEIVQRMSKKQLSSPHHVCDPVVLDPANFQHNTLLLRGENLSLLQEWLANCLLSMGIKHTMSENNQGTKFQFQQQKNIHVCKQKILKSRQQIKQFFDLNIIDSNSQNPEIAFSVSSQVKKKVSPPPKLERNREAQTQIRQAQFYYIFGNFQDKRKKGIVTKMLKQSKKPTEIVFDKDYILLLRFKQLKQLIYFGNNVRMNRRNFDQYGYGNRLLFGQFQGNLTVKSFNNAENRNMFKIYLDNLQFRGITMEDISDTEVLIRGRPLVIVEVYEQIVHRKKILNNFLSKMPNFILNIN